ncbi:MAG: cytochrome c biogenesis protein CcdA [Nitrospirae bacterium]|nr:MAG: cytochrome c biogenesis protein CcdA [Nitrospirota bacterium]
MFAQAHDITLVIAFAAGFLSFVSPCVLPLVPSYLIYITGLTLEELTSQADRNRVRATIVLNSLFFVLGLTAVFVAFGASASLIGQFLITYQDFLRKAGGVLIMMFGLYVMGVLKLNFLMTEKRIHLQSRPAGLIGSLLVGMAFAAGWTPCVGPILGTILMLAGTSDSMMTGVKLLASYSLGIGLPLFAIALCVGPFIHYFKKIRNYMYGISVVSGVFLILVGVMLYTNSLALITGELERRGIGWYF